MEQHLVPALQLSGAPLPTVSERPLNGNENYLVAARQAPIVAISSFDEIKAALKYAMVKVGLRAQNFPDDMEKQLLLEHVITNYGGHTPAEIKLAFNMAISGQLELTIDEVNCYENFSCLYFSKIMNAYRKWAYQTHEYLSRSNHVMNLKQLEQSNIDWRELIEKAYQQYLKKGEMQSRLFPNEYYTILVQDGYIQPDFHKYLLHHAKDDLDHDLQRQVTQAMQKKGGYDRARDLQDKLTRLRRDECGSEVEARAKQGAIIKLFKEAAKQQRDHLYIEVETK